MYSYITVIMCFNSSDYFDILTIQNQYLSLQLNFLIFTN